MRNKLLIIVIAALFAAPAFGLTPHERIKVTTALQAVDIAIAQTRLAEEHGRTVQSAADAATSSALKAEGEAILAKRSAEASKQKAITAEKQAAELKAQNDMMFPVYEQVNKGCGFGAFAYGFKKLMKCFLWFLVGGTVIGVALFFLAPAVFPAVGGFFLKTILRWYRRARDGIKKLKPKRPAPPSAN